MKVLVTGSRGFVGGSVGRWASRAGHTVLGLGRSSQPEADWAGHYAQADVASTDLSGIIKKFAPDVLLHAAGTASVGASLDSPLDDLRAALLTWANTLDGVRRSGVRPLIIFPSSAAVYGNPQKLPVAEDEAIRPISPYGFHKSMCEFLAQEYSICFGLEIIVCRFFSLFGEAQRRLLVWELYQQFAGSAPMASLLGTGEESRDYLHIDDAAATIFHLIESRRQKDERGGLLIANVASGEETMVLHLAGRIRDLVAPEKKIHCQGIDRPGDPRAWRADISLLRSLAPRWQPAPFPLTLSQCVTAWQKERTAHDGLK